MENIKGQGIALLLVLAGFVAWGLVFRPFASLSAAAAGSADPAQGALATVSVVWFLALILLVGVGAFIVYQLYRVRRRV